MKITTTQLRQIIREEIRKKPVKEASGKPYNGIDIFYSLRDKAFTEANNRVKKDLKGKMVEAGQHPKPPVVGKVLEVDLVEEYDVITYEVTLQTKDGKKVTLDSVDDITILN